MNLTALLGLLLPIAAGYFLARRLWWDRTAPAAPRTWLVGLTVVVGLGLGSCAYFIALVLSAGHAAVVALDAALLIAAGSAWAARRTTPARTAGGAWSTRDGLLATAVSFAAIAAAVAFLATAAAAPHGEWDAWAIWNLRARALARAGDAWRIAFAPAVMHADYPPLLPGIVAHGWTYAGGEPTAVPLLVAALFGVALVALLGGTVARLRGRSQALLACLALLGTPVLLRSSAWQYADVPFAACVLAALGLLAEFGDAGGGRRGALVLAGIAAGLAAGTKNEGGLFIAALGLAYLIDHAVRRERPDLRGGAAFVAGLLPAGILLMAFKLALAPPSYLFVEQSLLSVMARLADPSRHAIIAAALAAELWRSLGPLLPALAVYALLLGPTGAAPARRAGARTALVVALVVCGYAGVYAITPLDLSWQLAHSLDRLVLHVWPSALLALFLVLASPDEQPAPPPAAPPRRPHRRRRN